MNEKAIARVIAEHKGLYEVKNADGEYHAKVTGKRMHEASSREDYPAVGDWVKIAPLGDGQAVILDVLPRRTMIKRRHGDRTTEGRKDETQIIATNIDVAFVVESVDRDYSLNRFERYFALARSGGVEPAIIVNKIDCISGEELEHRLAAMRERFPSTDIITTSTVNNEGLRRLREYISPGKTYCFLGSSGVGKSSLINALLGCAVVRTGNISEYSNRGKHITTARQMYFLENGGIVIDNPGMREVGLADAGEGIEISFDKLSDLSRTCKYSDCTHTNEPGCTVISALKTGQIDENRYENYLNLRKEAAHNELGKVDKKEKDRRFGKFLKSAKKDLKRLDCL
ncbi:MAG: ribosome small subunit-dependent GTPase A [Candidatus Paceibacterota bacterium]